MITAHESEAALLRVKPYLSAYFARPDGENAVSARFRLELSRDDRQIPSIVVGDRRQRLASAYAPEQEADRTLPAGREKWKGTEIVLILGLGNPFVPLRLLPALRPGQITLAVDAFFDLGALLCRQHGEFRAYLERPGSHLFCGEELLEALWNYLDGLPGESLAGLKVVTNRASYALAPEFYAQVEERVKLLIKSKMSDLLTRFEFEKNWIRNIIINSRHLPAATGHSTPRTVRHFEAVLAGRPALLVSAGPSLRYSLDQIRDLQSRVFILACDTAYKVLTRAGITVHAVICLDAQKNSLFHFLGEERLRETLFFCDLVIHPSILRTVHPRAVIFSTTAKHSHTADGRPLREATPGTAHAESIYGPIGDVQSGGSVATTVYDLLRVLGAGAIYLVGQDLAYTGRQIHATGTHHNERWLTRLARPLSLETINESVVRRRHTHTEEGIGGEVVLCDYVLDLYHAWFEDAIPRAGVPTRNLTARGARIAAAAPIALAELLDVHPEIPDPRELFAGAGPLERFAHTKNEQLWHDLSRAVGSADDAGGGSGVGTAGDFLARCETLFTRHTFLRPLARRAETYLKRNQAKLNEERSRAVYERFVGRELRDLERGLRPYFSVDRDRP